MIRLGITGTDTGIGKTVVGAAVAALAREEGLRAAAMKPVETGVDRGDSDTDADLLRRASGARHPIETVCPVVLPEPLAPAVAARRAQRPVSLPNLDKALRTLSDGSDLLLVEGAGGLLVPVAPDVAFDTLFARWELDVVVVAGNRLGVLNHTLLTVEALRSRGLRLRSVVLNALAPGARSVAEETNLETLEDLLPDVPVRRFPWVEDPSDPSALAGAAREAGLVDLLRETPEP